MVLAADYVWDRKTTELRNAKCRNSEQNSQIRGSKTEKKIICSRFLEMI